MTEERRKGDRRIPPAVAQHLVEERGELLARIERLESEAAYAAAGFAAAREEISALKSHPSAGVVLPERIVIAGHLTAEQSYRASGHNACLDSIDCVSGLVVPDVLFDGFAVYNGLSEKAKARTGPENVADTLDSAVRLIRAHLSPCRAQPQNPLPHWEPCNPGCDTEFNGQRSADCAMYCEGARTALAGAPSANHGEG